MGALKCVTVVICILALNMALTTFTDAMPMVYKKNDQKNYEADLIPVSSTVIPLTAHDEKHPVKEHKLSEDEYKKIYMKHLHKKATAEQHPGLITVKTIHKKD